MNDGAMFVPILLGNDKTTVSVATGQNDFYPVYLSIGNVHNNVRRAHRNAVTVVAFLAIPQSRSFISYSISFLTVSNHTYSNARTPEYRIVSKLSKAAQSLIVLHLITISKGLDDQIQGCQVLR